MPMMAAAAVVSCAAAPLRARACAAPRASSATHAHARARAPAAPLVLRALPWQRLSGATTAAAALAAAPRRRGCAARRRSRARVTAALEVRAHAAGDAGVRVGGCENDAPSRRARAQRSSFPGFPRL
jgi:hypothetical protein